MKHHVSQRLALYQISNKQKRKKSVRLINKIVLCYHTSKQPSFNYALGIDIINYSDTKCIIILDDHFKT